MNFTPGNFKSKTYSNSSSFSSINVPILSFFPPSDLQKQHRNHNVPHPLLLCSALLNATSLLLARSNPTHSRTLGLLLLRRHQCTKFFLPLLRCANRVKTSPETAVLRRFILCMALLEPRKTSLSMNASPNHPLVRRELPSVADLRRPKDPLPPDRVGLRPLGSSLSLS